MLATPGELPDGAGWAYEVKWDGARCVAAALPDGGWSAATRSGRGLADRFPELAETTAPGRDLLLDGELVVLDEAGRPDFGLLQPRLHANRPRGSPPATYLVFDLLRLDGADQTGLPYRERRSRLEALGLAGEHLAVPPYWAGDRAAALAFARERGLEGVVAKRLASRYHPGARSPDWVKHRFTATLDALVVGWHADRSGAARSLLLAIAEDGLLRYAGRVGSGIGDREAARLGGILTALAADRPAVAVPEGESARWVRPRLVVEVSHLERTRAGRLRQPVFERVRDLAEEDDEPPY